MEIHRWWTSDSTECYWLEITDRPDLGANLHAPKRAKGGRETWGYSLILEARPGDIVFHWHKAEDTEMAIVGDDGARDRAQRAQRGAVAGAAAGDDPATARDLGGGAGHRDARQGAGQAGHATTHVHGCSSVSVSGSVSVCSESVSVQRRAKRPPIRLTIS